jgi:2'-5' RNA ligase
MRVFLALDLDIQARATLAGLITEGRHHASAPNGSWTTPRNLHLTLRFFGQLDDAVVRELERRVTSAGRGLVAPRAILSGIDGFPRLTAAKSLFADIGETESVRRVAHVMDEAALSLDLPRDAREFHPHITLARCKPAADCTEWAHAMNRELGPVQFPSCTLYESKTGGDGSVYAPLVSISLG